MSVRVRRPRGRRRARNLGLHQFREQRARGGVIRDLHDRLGALPADRVRSERVAQLRRVEGPNPELATRRAGGGDAFRGRRDARLEEDRGIRHLLELREHVARDEDGAPAVGEGAQQSAEVDARARVESRGGLVEQQHARVVHESPGEAEALLLAARQHARGAVGERLEVDEVDEFGGARRGGVLRDVVEARGRGERLAHCEGRPRAENVGHPADDLAHAARVVSGLSPPMRISPRSGASSVESMSSSVVLPEPLGPTRAVISPGRTSRVASRTACTDPKERASPDATMPDSGETSVMPRPYSLALRGRPRLG